MKEERNKHQRLVELKLEDEGKVLLCHAQHTAQQTSANVQMVREGHWVGRPRPGLPRANGKVLEDWTDFLSLSFCTRKGGSPFPNVYSQKSAI